MYKNNSLNSWKGIWHGKSSPWHVEEYSCLHVILPPSFHRYQRHGLVVVAVWAHLAIAADLPLHRSPPPPGLAEVRYVNYHNLG